MENFHHDIDITLTVEMKDGKPCITSFKQHGNEQVKEKQEVKENGHYDYDISHCRQYIHEKTYLKVLKNIHNRKKCFNLLSKDKGKNTPLSPNMIKHVYMALIHEINVYEQNLFRQNWEKYYNEIEQKCDITLSEEELFLIYRILPNKEMAEFIIEETMLLNPIDYEDREEVILDVIEVFSNMISVNKKQHFKDIASTYKWFYDFVKLCVGQDIELRTITFENLMFNVECDNEKRFTNMFKNDKSELFYWSIQNGDEELFFNVLKKYIESAIDIN